MSPNSVDFNFSRSSHLQLIILQISQVEQQAKDLKDQPFDLQSSSSHQTDHNLRLAIAQVAIDGGRFGGFRSRNEPKITYKYDRIDEVKKKCSSILPPDSNKKPYGKRLYGIKDKLSFINGDWWQDLDKSPLMPFYHKPNGSNSDPRLNVSSFDSRSPLNLVSFWVTDVDRAHRSRNSVNINGILQLGITMLGSFGYTPYENDPTFHIYQDHSDLTVSFQGIVYDNSEDDNNGDTVICLLGSTMLPFRYRDSSNPWDWIKEPGFMTNPPLNQDDQILLTIHYPKTFTLTKRGISGVLRSLNPKTNEKYFDDVHISSSLSGSASYEFKSQKLVSKACAPYPFKENVTDGIGLYKGSDFCLILERFTGQDPLTVVPNWKCNRPGNVCSKLGPFDSDDSIRSTNGSFKGVRLSFQDVRCEEPSVKGKNGKYLKVSGIIRVVPPYENPYRAAQRTGLNNMTLSVEGMWESSSGQLCMIGCRGAVDQESNGCDSRVCLYIPLSFSIQQRSIIIGTISSVEDGDTNNSSYFPLVFEKLVRASELYDQYTDSKPYYTYSKIKFAGSVLEKTEPFSFGTVVKKSLLNFPKLGDADSYLLALSVLSEDLTLHHPAVPDPQANRASRTDLQVEILSIGPLFGHYWSLLNGSVTEEDGPYHSKETYTEKQLLLNVSAQISLSGPQYGNFSNLFVEGLYHPLVGKMYLMGCRDVRASWNVLYESMDLENGLDCWIEVVVSYPPTTTRWLVNPTARISISSQRNAVDPLYFKPVKLQTVPIMYRAQREDILSRQGVEGILRALTLSVAIACILSELFYIKENSDSSPYVSIVMLSVQAFGYAIPLVTGAEAIFKKSKSYEESWVLEKSQMIQVIDYTVKILVLVSFSLIIRLYQKVWRARVRLYSRAPLEPSRAPSDKRVLLVTVVIHLVGFVCVFMVHKVQPWLVELEEYAGLVQDFFLLPQVIGNLIWQIGCIPLRKSYFIGLTVIQLLPHVYDYIRSPIPNPYFSEEYEFVDPRLDFYSKVGDVLIPVIAVLLAVLVHVQQKLGYEKLARVLDFGKFRVLPRPSVAYERLPPVVAEAEMTSGVNGDGVMRKDVDIE
ncbi:hypothetical protein E3N88_22932 [Mikania micrantha]|uniref:RING-type E3 ubiquitin transferase n=1 Tax=Mikania micrantha TaxID=192012 RepID=A0A5N6NBV0_9ASTR|nr:hypothetical protein E3N88_22932 [Mikania micrantha]